MEKAARRILREKKIMKIRYLLCCLLNKRNIFIKKHHIFNMFGNNVLFQPIRLPNDPQYIRIHDNVAIGSNVTFYNHDVINLIINRMNKKGNKAIILGTHLECIEIYDNVFIGGNSTILGGVSIGPNAIIAAGSVVTKDVPEGSIVGGCPAKVIGSFYELKNDRELNDLSFTSETECYNYPEEEGIKNAWCEFFKSHNNTINRNNIDKQI